MAYRFELNIKEGSKSSMHCDYINNCLTSRFTITELHYNEMRFWDKDMPLRFIFLFFLYSGTLLAEPQSVTTWTNKAILSAFAVHYNKESAQIETLNKVAMTYAVAKAISSFYAPFLPKIRDANLSIHPQFLLKPSLIDSGVAANIPFWQLSAELFIPELNLKVALNLMVLQPDKSTQDFQIYQIKLTPEEKS